MNTFTNHLSSTRRYWCHLCKREFNKIYIDNTEVQCTTCGNNFCEELSNNTSEEDHPSNFEPYESPQEELALPRLGMRRSSGILSLIALMLGMTNTEEEDNMESILNYLMANDHNRYGNPPASKSAVDKLEKISLTEREDIRKMSNDSSCSVCKDEFEVDQNLINLPCKHLFHDECIMPWLNERNSCPTCRFELPTDDCDYEHKKSEMIR